MAGMMRLFTLALLLSCGRAPVDPDEWAAMWKDVDKDSSNTISFSELSARLAVVRALRDSQAERLAEEPAIPSTDDESEKTAFAFMDADKSGSLDKKEMVPDYNPYETAAADGETDAADWPTRIRKETQTLIFEQADANSDGTLSPLEYVFFRCVVLSATHRLLGSSH
jgi:Ca2+-binding EF-hand superfamily protein